MSYFYTKLVGTLSGFSREAIPKLLKKVKELLYSALYERYDTEDSYAKQIEERYEKAMFGL
jgi:hypothetical protein